MVFLKETVWEKRLRLIFIFLIITVIALAFLWRFKKIDNQRENKINSPQVAVVHESEGENDHPYVAVYKFTDGKHIVALYQIIREQDFLFKTVAAAELRNSPEEIASDSAEIGVWVKISGKWHFFDESLAETDRSEQTKTKVEGVNFTTKAQEKETIILIVNDNHEYRLGLSDKVRAVFSLSSVENLWLAVTESDFLILHK